MIISDQYPYYEFFTRTIVASGETDVIVARDSVEIERYTFQTAEWAHLCAEHFMRLNKLRYKMRPTSFNWDGTSYGIAAGTCGDIGYFSDPNNVPLSYLEEQLELRSLLRRWFVTPFLSKVQRLKIRFNNFVQLLLWGENGRHR